MRCRFRHKWGRKIYDGSALYVRWCQQCGTMQRGIYNTWETIREHIYVKSQQAQIVRQRSFPIHQLAHTLGLLRTRVSDRRDQETGPRQSSGDSLTFEGEQHMSRGRTAAGVNSVNDPEAPAREGLLAERRRSKRVNVALPVILENATGVTRDVSASGVFFWKSSVFAYGESIRFSIERRSDSGTMMQKCEGVVVRTEPRGDDVGVAVSITKRTIERIDHGMAAQVASGGHPS